MISRGPWLLLDDSIGDISSRQSSGVCVGLIAVSVSLLDMQESLSVSSTTPRLSYSPRRLCDSVTPSLSSMAHLVKESLFEAIIRRLSRWNRRLRLSPRRLRVSLCLLDDSASLLFSSATP
ncbi:hypothetical protein F2Q68_00040775 [Brassica cretica]|uniref:Uncharacterized protein n=1 Tax=Brassica cretica TaxID=69181 RepID=A0A8S9MHB7_BRACR|nr:hypothetical protein F2Q68_00040775 [Brassica cretica]